MKLAFTIAVHGGPFTSQSAYSALMFTRACLEAGHRVHRVFFYQDGVHTGNALLSPPQDELNLHRAWLKLKAEYDLELIVCIAAAARRGVVNESEAARHNLSAHNLPEGFELTGLGQLVEACATTDRVINFGPAD